MSKCRHPANGVYTFTGADWCAICGAVRSAESWVAVKKWVTHDRERERNAKQRKARRAK